MARLGFVVQQPTSKINPLLRAGPSILVCVDNPGLIDSLKPLAPDARYIFRKYRHEQPLNDPRANAATHVGLLKPVIEKDGHRYDGVELYNEIAQNDLDVAKRFRNFQLHCLDLLRPYDIGVAVDNDPTWHPHFPEDWLQLWGVKSEVYAHPSATWRCRHEYIPQPHYAGGYDQWGRHIKEIEWLRASGKVVLPHYIGEWGWDKGPPVGPWSMGVTITDWIQGAKDFKELAAPEVIGWPYFGAGLDRAWPEYNLTSRRAPAGIVQAVAEYMKSEQDEPQPDPSWLQVPETVRQWYPLLSAESFRLWPYQTIPFEGVELHGDRIGACIILIESGGRPDAKSHVPAITWNGINYHAWGLMQVICRIPGHPSFNGRPAVEELLVPASNIRWGMAIFHGSLQASGGDLWEALRRYSGFARPPYTMADFWGAYGRKFRDRYEEWFGVRIPGPETDELTILREKVQVASQGLEGIENMAKTTRAKLAE